MMLFLALFVLFSTTVDGALVSHESGSCQPYPSSGEFCSKVLGGQDVFVYDGASVAEIGAKMSELFTPIDRLTTALMSPACTTNYLSILCRSNFPPCNDAGIPQRSCKGFCATTIAATCFMPFYFFADNSQMHNLANCEANIGDVGTERGIAYGDYPAAWTGEAAFPEGPTYVETAFGGGNVTMTCLSDPPASVLVCEKRSCPEPTVFRQTPKIASLDQTFANPEDLDYCTDLSTPPDCARCDSACEMQCPRPLVFTEAEFTWIWVATWLPGLLSMPLNVVILAVECMRLRSMKKSSNIGDYLIAIAASFSLLLFFMDALPAMILREDMRCAGHDNFAPSLNVDGLPFCTFGMLRVHVVQALIITLFFALVKIYGAISAAVNMRVYAGVSTKFRVLAVVGIVVVPSTFAALTLTHQSDQLFELHTFYRLSKGGPVSGEYMHLPNNIRYALACGPKYATQEEELGFVALPMIAATVSCLAVSTMLLRVVARMKQGSKSKGESSGSKAKGSNSRTNVMLAKAMMRFALASAFLVAANIAATLTFVPQALEFGRFMESWIYCALLGLDLDAFDDTDLAPLGPKLFFDNSLETVLGTCGNVRDVAPSFASAFFFTASYSMAPLAFALSFCIPAFKYAAHAKNSKMRSSSVKPQTNAGTRFTTSVTAS